MKYSIVIPTHNHFEDCLKPCVESVIKATPGLKSGGDTELIVVCNGCTDGSEAWVSDLAATHNIVLVSMPEKAGYTAATNTGISKASGEYVVLLNNDCVILDWGANGAWLDIMHEPFLKDKFVAVSGPKKIPMSDIGFPDRSFVVFFCAMIPKRVLDAFASGTGQFLDQTFSPGGGEDMDFCLRAQGAGMKTVSVPVDIATFEYSGTSYPIWHRGEATVHDGETIDRADWESGFWRRMSIVKERIERGCYDSRLRETTLNHKATETAESASTDTLRDALAKRTKEELLELRPTNGQIQSDTNAKGARQKTGNQNRGVPRFISCVVDICTRDRYHSLPAVIMSVLSQTLLPKLILVFCDDPASGAAWRESGDFHRLRAVAASKGVELKVSLGQRKGQAHGHENARTYAIDNNFEYVWRIDDDNYAEADVLEKLHSHMSPTVGAVAGSVPDPLDTGDFSDAATTMDRIFDGRNLQWSVGVGVVKAEHLYSTFLYRVSSSVPFRPDLSRIGHREETFFSHGVWLTGMDLIIDRSAVTWHLRGETGGLRSETDINFWRSDEAKFLQWLQGLKRVSPDAVFVLNYMRANIKCEPQLGAFLSTGEVEAAMHNPISRDALIAKISETAGLDIAYVWRSWAAAMIALNVKTGKDLPARHLDILDLIRTGGPSDVDLAFDGATTSESAIPPKPVLHFNMDFGMGDHIMALRVLKSIGHMLVDKKCVFYVCHNTVFDDDWCEFAKSFGISYEIKSVAEGRTELGKRFDELNPYAFMMSRAWTGHAMSAMRALYISEIEKLENAAI